MTAPAMKAVGIVRVSRVGDREPDSLRSPEDQRELIEELCADKGWRLIDEPYVELNVSGGALLEDRPGLSRAVMAVQTGRAQVIVAAASDRLWRNTEVRLQVLRLVEGAGGQVWTPDGRITNGGSNTKFTGIVTTAADELYKDQIRDKSAAAQTRAIAQGIPPISLPPGLRRQVLGTDAHGKSIMGAVELHPVEAPVMAQAVEMRANGAPIEAVRQHLAAHGIVRSYAGVRHMLRSPLLVGDIVFGTQRGKLEVQVVERSVWDRAQRVVVSRGRKAKSERLLARLGVLLCSSCGGRMVVGHQTKKGTQSRYAFYRCGAARADCPQQMVVSAKEAERVVVEATKGFLEGTVGTRAASANVSAARRRVAEAHEEVNAFTDVFAAAMDRPRSRERLAELQAAVRAAEDDLDRIEVPDGEDVLAFLDEDFDELAVIDQRRCIRAVVERAVVHPARPDLRPADRIEVVPWPSIEVLTGRTPQIPSDLT